MRELKHDGVVWRVHEADATSVPGARADHCLIFDSDGVVRRAWVYPASWSELGDETVWGLLDREVPSPVSVEPARRTSASADHPAVVKATAVAARTRADCAELAVIRDSTRALSEERAALFEQCVSDREEMRRVVHAYAESLQRGGMSPERTVILVKAAIQEGLGGAAGADEPGAEEFVSDGVAWCVEAYFAR